jgi:DNA-binding NarL/FixJ family response regulator
VIGSEAELIPALSGDDLDVYRADVVLVMPSPDVPWPTVRRVADAEVGRPVVVVAARWSDDDEQRALGSGATGYLALDLAPPRAVHAALRGEIVFRRRALGRWLSPSFQKPGRSGSLPKLTNRQQQVATLLTTGAADKEIAAQLGISVATVQKHVSKLLRAVGASNRAAAVWRILGGPDNAERLGAL